MNYRFNLIRKTCWVFVLVTVLISGCKEEDLPAELPPVLDGGVYILNEGNYQWGNASVDHYRYSDETFTSGVFQSANNRPLGDVAQSMIVYNGAGYIVVNNSSKIEVVSMTDFSSLGTITGLSSPRHILPLGNNSAYVSDLYSNSIHIVDLSSLQKTGSIQVNGSTEEMIRIGDTVYVCNTRTSYLYLVNCISNTLVDSILLSYSTNSMVTDSDQNLWVLCAGDETQAIHAFLYKINPVNRQVMLSLDLGNPLQIWDKLRISGDGQSLFYSDYGIWKMQVSTTQLPTDPLIEQGSRIFYGLGVDPAKDVIYVSDAIDYIQRGMVYRYSLDGIAIDSFRAGIIPAYFCFY